ncbi:hypothetical protein VNO78_25214 [Psophocarpus tetragonolobus]|uniref:Uncharacterized protein n=1 Tax=Psophocarpus tetragonolobus TaxID=3891 RepID=A0AAN9S6R1_PSOTE
MNLFQIRVQYPISSIHPSGMFDASTFSVGDDEVVMTISGKSSKVEKLMSSLMGGGSSRTHQWGEVVLKARLVVATTLRTLEH